MKNLIIIIISLSFNFLFGQNTKIFQENISLKCDTISENYYGELIIDPYRCIENTNDSIIIKWFKTQSIASKEILDNIKGKDNFLKKFKNSNSDKTHWIDRKHELQNGNIFYLKAKKGEEYYKLYWKKSLHSNEQLLYDPKDFNSEAEIIHEINYIKPSWDGKYVVISLSHSGKEISNMIIYDVVKQKVLPQIIDGAWPSSFQGVNWLPDNSGFTYLEFTIKDPSDKEFKKNTRSLLYKIGEDPSQSKTIFSSLTHPQLNINSGDYPTTKIFSSHDKYIIGYISGVDRYWDAYYTEIQNLTKENIEWKPLYKKQDQVLKTNSFIEGDNFIYLTSKSSPYFKIAQTNLISPDFDNPRILIEEKKNEIINSFEVTSDGIYFSTLKNGVEAKLYLYKNGIEEKISLPKKSGYINIESNKNKLFVSIEGWLNSNEPYIYDYHKKNFISDTIYSIPKYSEFNDLIIEEITVTSHDGEEIPLSLVYHKNLKKNGKNPTFIDGYGAYGYSLTPYFSTIMLNWVLEGGIFCTAHVRGGGEKGNDWYVGGKKTTKENTWKDLISCTEYLINKKYTSEKYTAIYSSSAGGILVGRAITERPNLFAVTISDVGLMNPLRLESMNGEGGANYKEFGSIKDSIECMALIEMDPYLHIKENTQYPAMLLTAGANDPRLPLWMPGKFVARLQNSDTNKPVLFDVDFNAGHEGGASENEKWANFFAFALWQMGHPDYQLKQE